MRIRYNYDVNYDISQVTTRDIIDGASVCERVELLVRLGVC